MYHGPNMLALVLMVKRNDPVTQSKMSWPTERTKKQEMRMLFLFLKRWGIIWKTLENSTASPIPEEGGSSSKPAEESRDFNLLNSERDNWLNTHQAEFFSTYAPL